MSSFDRMFGATLNRQQLSDEVITFKDFATRKQLDGTVAPLKQPLYQKTHLIGDEAGTVENVYGVRFGCRQTPGFVFVALSRNAHKLSMPELQSQLKSMQVRVTNNNGYENYMLCTGQTDREVAEGGFTFDLD